MLAADLNSLTGMPLLRRNEFDAAMSMLVVVPIYKRGNPLKGLDLVIHARLVGLAPAVIA